MPVHERKNKKGGWTVSHGGKVSAKNTSKKKADAQARLLRGVEHGWHPTHRRGKR
jgi:hypothetical protein